MTLETIRNDMIENVIKAIISENMMDENTKIFVTPTGRFVIGGPGGDRGLTGRKIIVDTYGRILSSWWWSFLGKDPPKVGRSGAYAARWLAKNIVAAGLAKKCEVQIAYAISIAHTVSVMIEIFGTSKYTNQQLEQAVLKVFDLRPAAIIENLDLKKPIYKNLAAYGHMGRENLDVRWEKTDKIDKFKKGLVV